jgi:RNA polymerase sigma-70 factor (ECF subfamily)
MTSNVRSQFEQHSDNISPAAVDLNAADLRAALSRLIPELRGFARFLVRDRAEADDLVQEALLRALRSLSQFRAGSNLRAWVFTILRNAHVELRRRRRTEAAAIANQFAEDEAIGPAQADNAELADLQSRLWTLSPVLREALILVGARGFSYEEAAEVCAVPVGTMKARVARARRQLTVALEQRAPNGTALAQM